MVGYIGQEFFEIDFLWKVFLWKRISSRKMLSGKKLLAKYFS
jgi:hypothetical protein